jgi:sulfoxide reductase heme-binding subunit YedZ
MFRTPIQRFKALFFILALIPLARLVILAPQDLLGANPIEKILHSTGYWTLVFLTITMGITPIRHLTGLSSLIQFRRMMGLFAFFYALLHFSTYVLLDQSLDLQNIIKDIVKRPYITIGMTGLVLLIPLALTSTNGMMKRLGGKRWKSLHKLTYLIVILGVLHFTWLVKKDISRPMDFAILFAVSMFVRYLHHRLGSVRLWPRRT